MEDNKFYTSYTKMDTYKECPQKYNYKYIEKLEKKAKTRSLYVGTHIHKLIELFYLHRNTELLNARIEEYNKFINDPVNLERINFLKDQTIEQLKDFLKNASEEDDPSLLNKIKDTIKAREESLELYYDTFTWREYLTVAIKEQYDQLAESDKEEIGTNYLEDLARIMAQYEYYYSNDNIVAIDLEHSKTCSLGNFNGKDVILNYICDGIVKLPNNKIYIIEHKSFKDNPMTYEETWLNVQTAIYVSSLRAQGYQIEGVLWDNIKSTAPKQPNVLKNGNYGKQTSNVTLFSFISIDTILEGSEAVREAIDNLPKEVKDLGVQENYNNFLLRHITVFNENAVDVIWKDTATVLQDITGNPRMFRNMGWTCNGCPYKEICQAEMLGQDSSELKSISYIKR